MYPFIISTIKVCYKYAFFLKSWNINIKFPLKFFEFLTILVWISLKCLFTNENNIKNYFFFSDLNPDQYVLAHQIRLLYSLWIKQNKDSTLKEPSKKDNFPIDSIQMQGSIIGMSHKYICLLLMAYTWFWTYVSWNVRSFFLMVF